VHSMIDPEEGDGPGPRRERGLADSHSHAFQHLAEIESIYRNAPIGLCVLDRDLRFVRINERLAEMNGATVDEHLGRTVREVIPDIAAAAEDRLRHVLETGEPVMDVEITGSTNAPSETPRTWRESWLPVHDRQGSIVGVNIVAEEITERKRVDRALRELTESLEEQVAERTALAEERANQLRDLAVQLIEAEERERQRVAHLLHDDLQQLLAGAELHLQVARRTVQENPALDRVENLLVESIEKSRRLSHELRPPVLNHSGLVAALQWLAAEMGEQFNLAVHLETDGFRAMEEEPIKVFLFRAARELLFNVVKHAGVDEAFLTLEARDAEITLKVTDRGSGFDPATIGQPADGLGLGLPSLRERARSVGGALIVTSEPGAGSTFTIQVPATPSRIVQLDTIDPASVSRVRTDCVPGSSGGHTLRVLVVDDHHVMRRGLVTMLSDQPGVSVVGEAANGADAVELVRVMSPDVVLMDVSMPVMGGVEATRRIKSAMPTVRVIGLSMHDDESIRTEMCDSGAETFVNKARSSATLLRAIYGPRSEPEKG
jgi:PAS domain S-box-containing protein